MTWQEIKEVIEKESYLRDISKEECTLAMSMATADVNVHRSHDWWRVLKLSIEIIRRNKILGGF